jgi:hypothetical protein
VLVLLPGFQKGRDIKSSYRKEHGAVLAKKGQFAAVVYRYCKRSSFPRSFPRNLFSQTEQYNDLSLIQANTFFKTVLKW